MRISGRGAQACPKLNTQRFFKLIIYNLEIACSLKLVYYYTGGRFYAIGKGI